MIEWKKGSDWGKAVASLRSYLDTHVLLHGPSGTGKLPDVLDDVCSGETSIVDQLLSRHGLTDDGLRTILSNVTMGIQTSGRVLLPAEGGWYVTLGDPRRCVVNPGFAAAWLELC